jgi:hypothetical protein
MKSFYSLVITSILLILAINVLFSQTNLINQNKSGNDMRIPKSIGEVKNYKGRPTIFLNGKPVSPMIYALSDTPGGRLSTDEIPQHNIKRFYNIGFRIFQLDIFLEQIWFEDDSFDLSYAKKQVKGVLDICPEAAIIFRFHVNAPKWWIAKNPDEYTIFDGAETVPDDNLSLPQFIQGDVSNKNRISLASKKWNDIATQKLIKFCNDFSKTEEGNALIGLHLANGVYGEWHYWGFLKYEPDLSQPMNDYFKEWLKSKYKSNSNLKKAWNNSSIAFETASVPTKKEREITSAGIFRDPLSDQKVIDYYKCQHELVTEDIIHFCRIVKENWPRKIITGAFYGYFFSVFNRLAAGGHLELEKILDSKYIDYISAPQVYEPECYYSGEPYRSRGLIHSVLLHNKLWLDEMDQELKKVAPFKYGSEESTVNYWKAIRENNSLITRNVMFTHSKGMGLWFYDFGVANIHTDTKQTPDQWYSNKGYWDHDSYMDNIKNLKLLQDRTLHQEYKSGADVLLVYDTEIMYHLKSTGKGDPVTHQLIDWTSLNTFYAGAVFDPILLSDLDKVDLSKYKIIVFANTFLFKEKDKKIVKDLVAKDNRHILWIYAPGYTDGNKIDPSNVSNITGFKLDTFEYKNIPKIKINDIIGKIPDQNAKDTCSPLFSINEKDKNIEILGYYNDTKRIGFAKKKMKNYTSWFIGVPPTDFNLLRYIYQAAGANIYTDKKDIVYSGSGITTYHSKDGGKKQIKLPNGKTLNLDLPNESVTLLIDNNTGEIIYDSSKK